MCYYLLERLPVNNFKLFESLNFESLSDVEVRSKRKDFSNLIFPIKCSITEILAWKWNVLIRNLTYWERRNKDINQEANFLRKVKVK